MAPPQTGLLMTVIRSLTASRDTEERDREKANLQREYNESDARLDKLVLQHHQDLTQVMSAFTAITTRLNTSKEKLSSVRGRLVGCQSLLNCKLDELKRLWIESVENKHILELLDQVEQLTKVPEEITNFMNRKHYLHATKLLVKSVASLESGLKKVDALSDVKHDLMGKKEELYNILLDDLHRHVYVKSTAETLGQIKIKNERKDINSPTGGTFIPGHARNKSSDLNLGRNRSRTREQVIEIKEPIEEDINPDNDPEEDSSKFISIIVECLSILHRVPDAIESIKDRADKELGNIVKRTGRELLGTVTTAAANAPSSNVMTASSVSTSGTVPSVLRASLILSDPEHRSHLLNDLFLSLFAQFRQVVAFHETILIPNLKRIESKSGGTIVSESGTNLRVYTMEDIWAKIQAVLEVIADFCLDIGGTAAPTTAMTTSTALDKSTNSMMQSDLTTSFLGSSSSAISNVSDLNSYFARKNRVNLSVASSFARNKRVPLFRFDSSSHAMSLNAYLQEQKEVMREKAELTGESLDSIDISETERYIVCPPAPENLVIMFSPLMTFIQEIDTQLHLDAGQHCPLHSYVTRSAQVFLKHVNLDLERIMDLSSKSLESWRVVSDPEALMSVSSHSMSMSQSDYQPQNSRNLDRMITSSGSKTSSASANVRPLLQSVLLIDRCIQDLRNLMKCLPLFADDFLSLIVNLLSSYVQQVTLVYKSIIQPDSSDGHHHHQGTASSASDKRIISASWAKDDDISRLLKSLPNWLILEKVKKNPTMKSLASLGSSLSFDEFPEEVRLRNMKESEILTSNLASDTLIPSHEILSDLNQLKILALLQESLEWLGFRIQDLERGLPKSTPGDQFLSPNDQPPSRRSTTEATLSDVSVATLNTLSRELEDLAETCLLVLHLEVRVHCFYYLLPVANSGNFAPTLDSQEADQDVIKLNKDLSAIDEALSSTLQSWKLRYIFEGVGHLVSTILINSATTIKKINENGVKKMCRNIFSIQQNLTSITMSREVALDYSRQFYELFYVNPEEILSQLVEKGPQFQAVEYQNAIQLLFRSGPSRDPAILAALLKKLDEILSEVTVSV